MTLPFTRLKGRGDGRPIVVCDIETWGLDARKSAFALGNVYDGKEHCRFTNADEMRDFLLSKRFRSAAVYAHNGGKFDYLALFGNYWLTFGPKNVVMREGRLIQLKWVKNNHHIYFRDSLNYLPTSLEKLALKFGGGLTKGVTPEKFKKADRAAGIDEADFQYCERDCEVLHRALTHIQESVGALRATLPSTAMATYRRDFFPNEEGVLWVRRDEDVDFRAAYYGGRVESYHIGKLSEPYLIWDINSLYPHAMLTTAFPDPHQLRYMGALSTEALTTQTLEGFAEVTVNHPAAEIGYLPFRQFGKLTFPVGRFRGAWCLPELRYAMSRGVTIEVVHQAVLAPGITSPFAAYVKKYYDLKNNATTDWEREIAKLMLNALYGKFCEFHETQEEYATEYDAAVHREYVEKWGECDWKPISRARVDGYYAFPSKDGGLVPHAIYSWGSYVTSQARVINAIMQDKIRAAGGNIAYTDTDSFTSEATIAANITELVGSELGLLKLVTCGKCQQPYTVQWVGGNKYYRKFCDCGSLTVQKGVRHNKETTYAADGTASWKSIVGLKEAIRRNIEPGSPIIRSRGAHATYDKRIVHSDGSTEPIRMGVEA